MPREGAPGEAAASVVVPVYDRPQYLLHYLAEGWWDGASLVVVGDGAPPGVVARLQAAARHRPGMRVVGYERNAGPARARGYGAAAAATPYAAFCDDDDFIPGARGLLDAATQRLAEDPGLLFVTLPFVYAFDASCGAVPQYDRRAFEGVRGRDFLASIVETGEIRALGVGTVFRREELPDAEAEPFFRVSEDYVLLARLAARYPDRRIGVLPSGAYLRLLHAHSATARSRVTLDRLVIHLVSMLVGAHALLELGSLTPGRLHQILLRRGDVLQASYGMGRDAACIAASLLGAPGPVRESPEGRQTLELLTSRWEELPAEARDLLKPALLTAA